MPDLNLAKWRKQINCILLFMAIAVTLLEVSYYIYLMNSGELTSIESGAYVRTRIFYPSLINYSSLLFNFLFQTKSTLSDTYKNDCLIATTILLCTVTVWVHYTLISALSIFVMPIVLSAIFVDRKKMYLICAISIAVMGICAGHTYSLLKGNSFIIRNIVVVFFMVLIACILSNIIITYIEERKADLISSYQAQMVLNRKVKMDPLTNLYNQHTFFNKLNESVELAKYQNEVFSMAILDIDNFKAINDTYGHSAGNKVLEGLSDLMGMVFSPKTEFVARYGGEEFGIIFKGMDSEQAFERIEQLRRHFSDSRLSCVGMIHVTFSGGIAQYNPGEESSTLFNRADAALYEAKRKGKNQTVTAQLQVESTVPSGA
ncbi:MAG: GGDEF domain-containing protein [Clostridium sp.]|uniref:GGDEF domain-containing protein n=1 Tax=Clostridium sp. TaxID=1506 RepID=UPI00290D90FA|nr:GGDEF domain-containing protein [Clostridium sp.]MDU7337313.1 GGDEF domain-containing protein [Clostridium sp.]